MEHNTKGNGKIIKCTVNEVNLFLGEGEFTDLEGVKWEGEFV
jgi:hypothetical protein